MNSQRIEKINDELDDIIEELDSCPIERLYIVGEINASISESVIKQLIDIDFTTRKIETIEIYISSEGGYLKDCFTVIDLIQDLKHKYNFKVKTFGLGETSSAGFFLLLLGDERIIYPNCRIFVHEHITEGADGVTYSERIKSDKTDQKDVYIIYTKYTSNRLGISTARVKRLLKKNKYLTNKEIIDYNIGYIIKYDNT